MSSLKHQITVSVAMLPVSMAIAVLLWLLQVPVTPESAAGLLSALILTVAFRWLSNALQLIRVRSWAVSSVFILLVAVTAPLHGWSVGAMGLCALYMVHGGALIFATEGSQPQTGVFISVLALACIAVIVPQVMWLLPLNILAMMLALRVWTGRTLTAVFLGLLLPFEAWAAWHLMRDTLPEAAAAFMGDIVPFSSFGGTSVDTFLSPYFLLLTPVILFTVFGIVHFLRTSLDDKISTRMRYTTLLLEWPVLVALFVWQGIRTPDGGLAQDAGCSSRLFSPQTETDGGLCLFLLLCSSPFLARYFVFSRGWQANVAFWLFVLSLLTMSVFPCCF